MTVLVRLETDDVRTGVIYNPLEKDPSESYSYEQCRLELDGLRDESKIDQETHISLIAILNSIRTGSLVNNSSFN